jgi:hypothetical protein
VTAALAAELTRHADTVTRHVHTANPVGTWLLYILLAIALVAAIRKGRGGKRK